MNNETIRLVHFCKVNDLASIVRNWEIRTFSSNPLSADYGFNTIALNDYESGQFQRFVEFNACTAQIFMTWEGLVQRYDVDEVQGDHVPGTRPRWPLPENCLHYIPYTRCIINPGYTGKLLVTGIKVTDLESPRSNYVARILRQAQKQIDGTNVGIPVVINSGNSKLFSDRFKNELDARSKPSIRNLFSK